MEVQCQSSTPNQPTLPRGRGEHGETLKAVGGETGGVDAIGTTSQRWGNEFCKSDPFPSAGQSPLEPGPLEGPHCRARPGAQLESFEAVPSIPRPITIPVTTTSSAALYGLHNRRSRDSDSIFCRPAVSVNILLWTHRSNCDFVISRNRRRPLRPLGWTRTDFQKQAGSTPPLFRLKAHGQSLDLYPRPRPRQEIGIEIDGLDGLS